MMIIKDVLLVLKLVVEFDDFGLLIRKYVLLLVEMSEGSDGGDVVISVNGFKSL